MPLPILALLHDGTLPPGLERIEELATVRPATAADLAAALPGAEILLAWDFLTPALGKAGDAATELRWIHTASAGVDNVLTAEVAAADVVVRNARGVFDTAIAEYVLGLVLMFAKDLPGTWERQRQRRWEHRDTGTTVGRTAVVVGVGPIGREICATWWTRVSDT
jgi:phosphoglycerate dehydrogenase-like enzyme